MKMKMPTPRQVAGVLTGADVIGDLWSTVGRPVLNASGRLQVAARPMARAAVPEVASTGDGKRDFALAMERWGVTEEDLPRFERRWWRQWALSVVLATLLLCLVIVLAPGQVRSGTPLWLIVLSFGALFPVLLARIGTAGAHLHMLRTRDFGSPLRVFFSRAAWLPQEAAGVVPKSAGTALLSLLFLCLVVPSIALAANLTTGAPSSDPSLKWLDAIIPIGGTATPWSVAVGTFSSILLLAGSASVGWSSLNIMVQAAHTGRTFFEGGIVHPWGPVRLVIGVLMLAPVLGSGLNGGEYLVWAAARQGIAWADTIQSNYVHAALTDLSVGLQFAPATLGGADTVEHIARLELCRASYQFEHQANNQATRWVPTPDAAGHLSGVSSWTWDYGRCGGIGYSGSDDPATASYHAARAAAIGVAVSAARTLANAWASADAPSMGGSPDAWPRDIHAALAVAGAALDAADLAAAKSYLNGRTDGAVARIVAASDATGWTGMGTIYRSIGQISGQIADLSASQPSYRSPASRLGTTTSATLAHFDALIASGSNAEQALNAADLSAPADSGSSNPLVRLVGPSMRAAIESLGTSNPSASVQVDPMSRNISSGQNLLAGTEVAIAAGGGVALATGSVFGKLAGADSLWQWASTWAVLALGTLLTIAITQAFVIPNLIYVSVVFFVVGYCVTLVECVLAVSVWFVLWTRFEGTELLSGGQKGGLAILLNPLLRPALGVLAVASTYTTLPIGIGWVDSTFGTEASAAQAGSVSGIVTVIFNAALHAYLVYQIVLRFGAQAVLVMPDLVLRWLGVAGSKLGEAAAAAATHLGLVGGVGVASTGAASGSKPGGGGGGGSGGGGGPRKGPSRGSGEPAGGSRGVSRGGAGGGEAASGGWSSQSGGFDALSPDDQEKAAASHADWLDKSTPEEPHTYGLDKYVEHAQTRDAKRRGE